MDALRQINRRRTPQTEQADARQVANSAGGFVFSLDDHARLRRFLTLGVDGGTYYASDRTLALENAAVLTRLAASDPDGLVRTVVEVSEAGRAPRNNPALFALAYAASVPEAAPAALAALPRVARTGTHLFLFATYVEQFRGWGRGLRNAVSRWYTDKTPEQVAFQAVKYRQREGWSHRDLLRLAHPATQVSELRDTFEWIARGTVGERVPGIIDGFVRAQEATTGADWARLVRDHGLTWEMLPDAALAETAVWDALLDAGMPQTALMRQLPRLTRLGMLPDAGGRTAEVAAQLADPARLAQARVHPVNVLVAQRTYASGRSARGAGAWEPGRVITDALDAAFYAAFGAVQPSGTRTMLAVDVSGSMMAPIAGMPLSARAASTALALVQIATEPATTTVAFSCGPTGWWNDHALTTLAISPRQRLEDAIRLVNGMPMGGTDCALPMLHATEKGLKIDTFVVYTDNETWHGEIHPHQALQRYRESSGIAARLVVVGMTATGFSIADPDDAGMLDVAGFDSAVPQLVADFARDA